MAERQKKTFAAKAHKAIGYIALAEKNLSEACKHSSVISAEYILAERTVKDLRAAQATAKSLKQYIKP